MSADGGAPEGRVHLRLDGAVAHIVFDRPHARNAMTWAMYRELADHCRALAANPAVRVTTFRGAGGEAFVAGTDIAQFRSFASGEDGVAYERGIDEGIALIEALSMPTVAIVEGWCVGGGLAIATACDFRVAAHGAKFGVPIARTVGNTLSIANLARVHAAFGLQRARRMLLLAQTIDDAEALACGYLHATAEPAALQAQADALVAALAALAPVTQSAVKEGLRRIVQHGLPEADDLIRRCYGSADFREAVSAFVDKRKPAWTGR